MSNNLNTTQMQLTGASQSLLTRSFRSEEEEDSTTVNTISEYKEKRRRDADEEVSKHLHPDPGFYSNLTISQEDVTVQLETLNILGDLSRIGPILQQYHAMLLDALLPQLNSGRQAVRKQTVVALGHLAASCGAAKYVNIALKYVSVIERETAELSSWLEAHPGWELKEDDDDDDESGDEDSEKDKIVMVNLST
ncbi:unnamed protein product [Orchesella dallaii]|uniref:Uncharacterized protein n=1 Tax=Orchesella dallaii TaxID=48710 RepID=A0ABP1QPH0_9HEXA